VGYRILYGESSKGSDLFLQDTFRSVKVMSGVVEIEIGEMPPPQMNSFLVDGEADDSRSDLDGSSTHISISGSNSSYNMPVCAARSGAAYGRVSSSRSPNTPIKRMSGARKVSRTKAKAKALRRTTNRGIDWLSKSVKRLNVNSPVSKRPENNSVDEWGEQGVQSSVRTSITRKVLTALSSAMDRIEFWLFVTG
jgi:hypothetical protein